MPHGREPKPRIVVTMRETAKEILKKPNHAELTDDGISGRYLDEETGRFTFFSFTTDQLPLWTDRLQKYNIEVPSLLRKAAAGVAAQEQRRKAGDSGREQKTANAARKAEQLLERVAAVRQTHPRWGRRRIAKKLLDFAVGPGAPGLDTDEVRRVEKTAKRIERAQKARAAGGIRSESP